MQRIILSFFVLFVSFGLAAKEEESARQRPLYKSAGFTDAARMERVRALSSEIEQIYREHALANQFPGLAWGVVLDGKLVLQRNYGVADVAKKTPVSEKTLFRIASMSKSVTALAIMRLRDDGKLRLDDPASKHLPEMRKVRYPTKDSPEITIRDLLTHSAGFPEDNPWGDWQLADKEEDLIELMRNGVSFSNPPGLEYEYSNLGFALLGRIVSKVSGNPYQQYIRKTILIPLGMPSTEWEYIKVPANLLAHGYRWEDNQWKEEALLHDGAYGAMGGLISSVEEFARYMALHLEAWPPRDEKDPGPVKRSSVRQMHQPGRMDGLNLNAKGPDGSTCPTMSGYAFGLGWTKDCSNRVSVGHSGGLPGFGSHWRIFPEYGLGVVALANRTYANAGAVNAKVLNLLLHKAALQPRELPVSAILEQRKNELVKFLPDWKDADASGIFAENFFKDQSLDRRRKTARELFDLAGGIQSIGPMKPLNQLRGTFRVEGTKNDLEVSFTLTPENPPLIQELRYRAIPKK